MEQKFYKIFRKSIAARLLLLFSLLVGGGNSVVADDIVIYDEGSEIPTGWTGNTYISCINNELVSSGSGAGYITSSSSFNFTDKKLVVVAKRTDDTDSYVQIANKNGYIFSVLATFGYGTTCSKSNELYDSDNYIEVTTGNISVNNVPIRITARNAKIKSIKLSDTKSLGLDQSNPTSLLKGAKSEDVNFKYTPKTGWNTICVPFQLRSTVGTKYDHLKTIFGSDYSAFKFSGYTNGTLSFTKNTSSISANIPLLVYAPNGDTQAAANPDGFTLSSNVTIAYSKGESDRATTANDVTFQGTYAPIAKGNMPSGSYGITNSGQIVNAGVNSSIKGYRAYLTGLGSAGARIMILDDESNTPTDIGLFKMAVPEAKDVYTLSGQRVQKARKGIYVINGKKIVIK